MTLTRAQQLDYAKNHLSLTAFIRNDVLHGTRRVLALGAVDTPLAWFNFAGPSPTPEFLEAPFPDARRLVSHGDTLFVLGEDEIWNYRWSPEDPMPRLVKQARSAADIASAVAWDKYLIILARTHASGRKPRPPQSEETRLQRLQRLSVCTGSSGRRFWTLYDLILVLEADTLQEVDSMAIQQDSPVNPLNPGIGIVPESIWQSIAVDGNDLRIEAGPRGTGVVDLAKWKPTGLAESLVYISPTRSGA